MRPDKTGCGSIPPFSAKIEMWCSWLTHNTLTVVSLVRIQTFQQLLKNELKNELKIFSINIIY